jgi:predicted transcriptional regulator
MQIDRLGNKFITGGDFNTIINQSIGHENLDREGNGRVPNSQNSRIINEWIGEGWAIEPFRTMFPLQRETSYIPFRMDRRTGGGVKYGKTRLDFFLISPEFMEVINKVKYEGRLSSDFDHKEATLYLGKRGGSLKLTVSDRVLDDILSEYVGYLAVYESISTHLSVIDRNLSDIVVQLDLLTREKELLVTLKNRGIGQRDIEQRLETNNVNLITTVNRLPDINVLLDRELTCTYGTLYEVIAINLKNKLVAIQTAREKIEQVCRVDQLNRIQYCETMFGFDSIQAEDEREKLLRMDDLDLKSRANKFREFLDNNNEKATKAFCRLGKEGGVCDDITQIIKDDGGEFEGENERGSI